jgi:hypothetical protein
MMNFLVTRCRVFRPDKIKEQGNCSVKEALFPLSTASPSAHILTHFGLSVTIGAILDHLISNKKRIATKARKAQRFVEIRFSVFQFFKVPLRRRGI